MDKQLKKRSSRVAHAAKLGLILLWAISSIVKSQDSDQTRPSIKAARKIDLHLPFVAGVPKTVIEDIQSTFDSHQLGQIKVHYSTFWHRYQQGLRLGRPGIYFAQHHFATWAVNRHQFQPILRLHGELKFVLAVNRADKSIFEISDLSGKTICRESGLNLGTVWLNNLIGRARINANLTEVDAIVDAMLGESPQTSARQLNCDAFVIEDDHYQKVNQTALGQFIRLAQSPIYHHNSFVASPDLSKQQIDNFVSLMRSTSMQNAMAPYYSAISKWQTLRAVKLTDYPNKDAHLLTPYWGRR